MNDARDEAIRLYDAYTHEHLDRRRLLREVTALAGSVAAAEALIGAIGASPAAAQVIAPDDPRIRGDRAILAASSGESLSGYEVAPAKRGRSRSLVLVIHENRGLNPHIQDVTRRLAVAGFRAFAPDYLAQVGGTPADQDAARAKIAALDLGGTIDRTVAVLDAIRREGGGRFRVGAVGFCWGGAFVNRLAVAAGPKLAAGVSYYGPAPAAVEAAKVQAAMMIHLAGNDARVNATALPWVDALKAAEKRVEAFTYPGADHAFNNDASAERYDRQAADLAWNRTLAFLRRELGGGA